MVFIWVTTPLYQKDIQVVKENPLPKEGFVGMELFGRSYSDKEAAAKMLYAAREKTDSLDKPKPIGHYRGFELLMSYDQWNNRFVMTLKGGVNHKVDTGRSAMGNITRLDNELAKCEERLSAALRPYL